VYLGIHINVYKSVACKAIKSQPEPTHGYTLLKRANPDCAGIDVMTQIHAFQGFVFAIIKDANEKKKHANEKKMYQSTYPEATE
jgi:hypothetical protein